MQILIDLDHTMFNTDVFRMDIESNRGLSEYKHLLYPDVFDFLEYASKYGNLVLFSEGEKELQLEKIKKTGLDAIFGENVQLYASGEKAANLQDAIIKDSKSVLIDDKPEVIDRAISLGIKTIRVRRGKYSELETVNKPTETVSSLEEVVSGDLLNKI